VKLWGAARDLRRPSTTATASVPPMAAAFGGLQGLQLFTASCKKDRLPRVVDETVQDIMDPRLLYSGLRARVR
jgi:hypothetical protein